jgi:hypothetical protein
LPLGNWKEERLLAGGRKGSRNGESAWRPHARKKGHREKKRVALPRDLDP